AWENLANINSVDIDDLYEYNSRPTEKVIELVASRKDNEIVIYGATGKWMSDMAEMLLRAIRQAGIKSKLHIVSSLRRKSEFSARFAKYNDLIVAHEINLLNAKSSDLDDIPNSAKWIIYGVGYKFRTTETDEEYARLCGLYGNEIPKMVISHHDRNADIIVIGSANGIELTRVDAQAKDDAPIVPKPGNLYGISIRDKEKTIKETLNGKSSKAVILRGGYMTDLTYGGIEPIVKAVLNEEEIDLSNLTYFNIIGHRDANIYAILSVTSVSNPVTTLNLSGHTADVRLIAETAGKAFGKIPKYNGEPAELHLLMDGSKIESLYGKPIDSLMDLINAQIYWIKNGGYSRNLDHKVGKSL
ncbi:MAG: hypothetical protein ACPL7B_11515, partial [Candidatus Poribacteria bacterium]